ncbi:MAG: site-2 protease family protein [Candidatus Heimdallarchaeota archaeon]|nr:MAG: site-2 protease family protein [Candidatus Heimdallarchaeota archaeon]
MFNNIGFWAYSKIDEVINSYFTVTAISYKPLPQTNRRTSTPLQIEVIPAYEIIRRSDLTSNMEIVNQELREYGFIPLLRPHPTQESRAMLYIFPLSKRMRETEQKLTTPLILFGLTVLSVFFVGFMSWDVLRRIEPLSDLNPIVTSLLYAIGLIGIVGIHELGHMFVSRMHGVKASWPYFLPFPFGYGTFGAFISQKTPIKSKNDLFDVGLAGPIFGFIASIFFTIVGLMISFVVDASVVPENLFNPLTPMDFRLFSDTRLRIILFEALAYIIIPNKGGDTQIFLHPLAFAGYIGLLLTGINLIPIGQLDGGHVARSLFSENNHRILTYLSAGLIILLIPELWLFAILILLMYSRTGHAGPLDDLSTITLSRKIIATLSIVLAVLCLPIPVELFNLLFPFFS